MTWWVIAALVYLAFLALAVALCRTLADPVSPADEEQDTPARFPCLTFQIRDPRTKSVGGPVTGGEFVRQEKPR